MNRFAVCLGLAAALVPCLVPTHASACFDGISASSDRVTIAVAGDDVWSPEVARHWARWVGRISALVPEGKTLQVIHGTVEICEAGTDDCRIADVTWDDGRLFTLFELTADLFAAPRTTIAAARHADGHPLTVQVAASGDRWAAERLAQRINAAELELSGFLDVGGFPSTNAYAHVVASPISDVPTYHVVVGAFLERGDAEAALGLLDSELGVHGYVRALDQVSAADEGC